MNLKDGGPAFPVEAQLKRELGEVWDVQKQNDDIFQFSGMTLRDYFAAKAPPVPEDFVWAPKETDSYQRLVRWSYFYADAMLAARNK